MNEETFNMSIRKFLKTVGVTSQREIEKAVRGALEAGLLEGGEELPVTVTLTLPGAALEIDIDGKIALE
ncbi:MAG: hypothetical protein GWP66_06995 [Gammaproteobacteria bacterium]|jgi:hypothetical protein|nr:hypothetical protein [Gammaproteobacteria bacterium]